MNLSEKRKLSAALKELHGERWNRHMHPMYDERGFAAVYLTRYDRLDCIKQILDYPIYHLQMDILKGSRLEDIKIAIPVIIRGLSSCLEFLQLENVPDTTTSKGHLLRDVLPKSGAMFENMTNFSRLVVGHINFGNAHFRSICRNKRLTSLEVRNCDITSAIEKSLVNIPQLEYLILRRCKAISSKYENSFRRKLPNALAVRITD